MSTASGYAVKVWVDANSPVLRLQASNNKSAFSATASLEVYRDSTKKTALGRGFCSSYLDIPDTVVPPTADGAAVTWYHRNDYSLAFPGGQTSFYDWSMQQARTAAG